MTSLTFAGCSQWSTGFGGHKNEQELALNRVATAPPRADPAALQGASASEAEPGGLCWGHADLRSVMHQGSPTSNSLSSSPSRLWGDLRLVTNHSFCRHFQTIGASSSPTLDPPGLSVVPQGICPNWTTGEEDGGHEVGAQVLLSCDRGRDLL